MKTKYITDVKTKKGYLNLSYVFNSSGYDSDKQSSLIIHSPSDISTGGSLTTTSLTFVKMLLLWSLDPCVHLTYPKNC